MTDSHMSVRGTDAPTILYSVAGYRASGVERELLLVDPPQLGRTLVDVRAHSGDDQHIVVDGLLNCADAGEAADAHVAASIAAGRPAVPTAEPPTPEQLRFLEAESILLGQRFESPRNRAEASKRIRRARGRDTFDLRRIARERWEAANAGRFAADTEAAA